MMMNNNKYLQIYQELLGKIRNAEFMPMETLPSEKELTKIYGTSRETIRKALSLLVEKGAIQKVRGKGSIVLGVQDNDFPVNGLVSFQEFQSAIGEDAPAHLHDLQLVKPDAKLAERLQATKDFNVWSVVRSRDLNGKRSILSYDYFLQSIVPALTQAIAEESIYRYLHETLKLPISYARLEVTMEDATEQDKQLLDLEGFDLVVVTRAFVHLDSAMLFHHSESRQRPDTFKHVKFIRKQP